VDWQLVTDVSAQPICHIFKSQTLQEEKLNIISKIFIINFNIKYYYLGQQSTVFIKIFRRNEIHCEDSYRDLVRNMRVYIYSEYCASKGQELQVLH